MGNITFANPSYLYWLLAVLPLAAAFWYASFWFRRKTRQQYGEAGLVDRYTRKPGLVLELLQLGGWLVVLTLLVVATAGPLQPDAPQRARTGSLQVVIVMDVSKSMAAEDYRSVMPGPDGTDGALVVGPHGSRLDMTKYLITTRIMPAIQGNQIGVVTYTGSGFPQADLTDDYTALRFVLTNWVKVGSAPGGGSDFSEGLKEALATFKRDEDPNKEKVIVLFSDGGFTGDQAELAKVTQELAAQRVRLIIVGLGMPAAIPIPVYDENGQLTGYFKKDDKVVTTAIEEANLTRLAAATGGEYIHLTNDKDLQIQWATTLAGTKVEPRVRHVYQYPLGVALALLLVLSARGLFRGKDVV
ncbi:MAG TPA: vWA domain-containing protein [Candidatus Obscuribacterales bacterium]